MPISIKDGSQYEPSRSYKIKLTIKDKDYSSDLNSIRIVSSITAAYPIFTLSIAVDPNDIVLDNIFGKNPLKLQINLIGRGDQIIPLENITVDLVYLGSNLDLQMKPQLSEGKAEQRQLVDFTLVPKKALKAMGTMVNKLFTNQTPSEIISDLVKEADCELAMDTDGKNEDRVDQILVSPSSLYKSIRYLDNRFGIYNGACNLGYCQYDNKFKVMNLTKRLTKNQTFTVYHLASDSDDSEKIIQKCSDGKNFYTYTELKNSYDGNTVFSATAKKLKVMTKPDNALYSEKEYDLSEICEQYGANSKAVEGEENVDSSNERNSYVTVDSGYGEGTVPMAAFARKIIGLSKLEFDLEKDLPILGLLNIGEPVKLITKTAEYIPLQGKYLLRSSDINFSRISADWVTTCHIVLCRTNKSE